MRTPIPHEDGISFLIPLTRGFFARIDADDLEKVKRFTWFASGNRRHPYACTSVGSGEFQRKIAMHRLVTDCPDGMVPDHLNFDRLDNRKANLHICTQSDNSKRKQKKSPELRAAEVANQEQREKIGIRIARKALATKGITDPNLEYELGLLIAEGLMGYIPVDVPHPQSAKEAR